VKLSKKAIILFLLLLIAIFFMQYDFFKSNSYKLPSKSITYFDANIFKMYNKEYNTSIDTNPYWGFAKDSSMFKENNETNQTDSTSMLTKVDKKKDTNVLCITSSCYRLLGIYYNENNASITLYNKDFKNKIKAYTINDTIKESIIISDIKSTEVLFKDINSTREWHFEIFDVNTTKYKPKEIQK